MKGLLSSHHRQHISSVMPAGYITTLIISSAEVFLVELVVVFLRFPAVVPVQLEVKDVLSFLFSFFILLSVAQRK